MKTCVQIGLNKTAECLYLANKDVPKDACGAPGDLNLPEELEQYEWRFFGVDSDVNSISMLANRFPIHPYCHWINARIIPRGVQIVDDTMNWCDYYKNQTVTVLGTDLSHLFKHLNLDTIDLLVMDIEGAEWDIWEAYDWLIKPDILLIELHKLNENYTLEKMNNLILSQGYKHVYSDFHGLDLETWVGMHARWIKT